MSNNLFRPKFTITQSILNKLMEIEKARGFLEAARLSDKWIKKMSRNAVLLETHHTTHIEGTMLTLDQSKKVLANRSVSGLRDDDVKELKNYRDAFGVVTEFLKKETAITEPIIKEIHKELVKDVRGNNADPGHYRTIQNYIVNVKTEEVVYEPPGPEDVSRLMSEFVAWINSDEQEIHPVLKSGIIQFQLVHIHPFIDGNGRTSRLLCALYLYRSDYDFKKLFSISEYYDKNRMDFYNAIQSVRENEMDMTTWLEYFVEGFLVQMNEVMEIGKKVIRKDSIVEAYSLSKRQAVIIEHILENEKLLPKDFDKLCVEMGRANGKTNGAGSEITRRTLQRDLKDMVDKKVLKAQGATHQQFYILTK